MFLSTPGRPPEIAGTAGSPDSNSLEAPADHRLWAALQLAGDLAGRYGITALAGLLAGAREAMRQDEIGIAVLGRFKAGKSSFLNHFMGRDVLPVGVVPLTAVVTEAQYGARELARVHYRDGRDAEVRLDEIAAYISEKE